MQNKYLTAMSLAIAKQCAALFGRAASVPAGFADALAARIRRAIPELCGPARGVGSGRQGGGVAA